MERKKYITQTNVSPKISHSAGLSGSSGFVRSPECAVPWFLQGRM